MRNPDQPTPTSSIRASSPTSAAAPTHLKSLRTATVADIYARQGKYHEARMILLELLDGPGNDRSSRVGRMVPVDHLTLRKRLAQVEQAIVERERDAERETYFEDPENQVLLSTDKDSICCTYTVSEEGQARASNVLACRGTLCLTIALFSGKPEYNNETIPLRAQCGDVRLRRPSDALFVVAAIGMQGSGPRFVSITHSPLLVLAPSAEDSHSNHRRR